MEKQGPNNNIQEVMTHKRHSLVGIISSALGVISFVLLVYFDLNVGSTFIILACIVLTLLGINAKQENKTFVIIGFILIVVNIFYYGMLFDRVLTEIFEDIISCDGLL